VYDRSCSLSQYLEIGPVKDLRDSLHPVLHPGWLRIGEQFVFRRSSFTYTDVVSDSSFYHDFYYSKSASKDSTSATTMDNTFTIDHPGNRLAEKYLNKFNVGGSIMHHWTRIYEEGKPQSYETYAVGFGISTLSDTSEWKFVADAKYALTGTDQGNYLGQSTLASPEFRFGQLLVTGLVNRQTPDLFYTSRRGNHFRWSNDFDKPVSTTGSVNYVLKRYQLSLGVRLFNVQHFIYMNESARPAQIDGSISVQQFFIRKNFHFGYWHLDNEVILQKQSAGNVLPLPGMINYHSLFIEKPVFHSAMLMRVGSSVYFHEDYYGNKFMPVTGLFYLQGEEIKTGGYPLINVFINVKIKTARLFLLMENAGSIFLSKTYLLVPSYPMPGMSLKFGIDWRFYDQ